LLIADAENERPKKVKIVALLLRDGHPSPLGEGPGVRGYYRLPMAIKTLNP